MLPLERMWRVKKKIMIFAVRIIWRNTFQLSLVPKPCSYVCMFQQRGNEVERQGKVNKSLHPGELFLLKEKRTAALDGIQTHVTLLLGKCSTTELQAGRGSNLQQANLKPLCYGAVYSHSLCRSRPG